jgi:hypothetical protein|uniref:Uncharacterized protein n=1 Tax=Zea mays TaxID=4577 RepID=B4FXK3_MAIZE|nr:unknown [Zea mays]|eukprot:NP_001141680.1 uncharacterized protein LOC100273807 [Zea mays]
MPAHPSSPSWLAVAAGVPAPGLPHGDGRPEHLRRPRHAPPPHPPSTHHLSCKPRRPPPQSHDVVLQVSPEPSPQALPRPARPQQRQDLGHVSNLATYCSTTRDLDGLHRCHRGAHRAGGRGASPDRPGGPHRGAHTEVY